jgi:hypothetical protein
MAARKSKQLGRSVAGWVFNYEHPGYFFYRKGNLTVACTPDWAERGEVCVQMFNDNSEDLNKLSGGAPYSKLLGAAANTHLDGGRR